jgi:hypothetical protein
MAGKPYHGLPLGGLDGVNRRALVGRESQKNGEKMGGSFADQDECRWRSALPPRAEIWGDIVGERA